MAKTTTPRAKKAPKKDAALDPNFVSLRLKEPKGSPRDILEGIPCSSFIKGSSVILEDKTLKSTGTILAVTPNSITTREGEYIIYKTRN